MDLAELVPVVHQLVAAGIAPSTAKTYMSGQNQYLKFCEKYYLQPFPTSESALTLFVAYLHQKALSPGTIKSYLAAIRYHQISQGLKDPNVSKIPHLEYVIKGIKRLSPQSTRRRLPITPSILIKLKEVWKADRNQLDPFCQGFTIHLGATRKSLCPVASLLQFMALQGGGPGPPFKWKTGKYLTRTKFVASLRKALSAAGYDERKFAGHSFRIGAATTAAQRGLEDSLIKTLGRWKYSAYTRYIRTLPQTLQSVAKTLISRV